MWELSCSVHVLFYVIFCLLVPPTIEAVDEEVLGVVGMNATISFSITRASPEVARDDIRWTFVSLLGLGTEDITPGPSMNPSDHLVFSEDLLNLTIVDIRQSGEGTEFFQADEGSYVLTASNAAGVRTASVNLIVEGESVLAQRIWKICDTSSQPLQLLRCFWKSQWLWRPCKEALQYSTAVPMLIPLIPYDGREKARLLPSICHPMAVTAVCKHLLDSPLNEE